MEKKHQHLIVRARVTDPPTDQAEVENWLIDIVHSVGMKVMIAPVSAYSDVPGNEGITALVALDFSHATVHIWDKYKDPLIEFDLFSCKEFDVQKVIDKIEPFGIISIATQFIDRDELEFKTPKKCKCVECACK